MKQLKWKHKVDIKQYFGEDDSNEDVVKAAQGIVKELKKLPESLNEFGLLDVISEFEDLSDNAATETSGFEWSDEFNYTLDKLYEWADDQRIWLGI